MNMETRCKICVIHSEIKCLERTIKDAESIMIDLLEQIPIEYETKQITSNWFRRKTFVGLCGRCPKHYEYPYYEKEKKLYDNFKRILSYVKDYPNKLSLYKLKKSLEDYYPNLYRIINNLDY